MTESSLAAFLETRRDAIVAEFEQRVARLAPVPMSRSALRNHLPMFLDELAAALRQGVSGDARLDPRSAVARAHGLQRVQIGFSLEAVVREYGILGDAIFHLLIGTQQRPGLDELRVLVDSLAGATADSVTAYASQRYAASEGDRHHFLELVQQSPGFVAFLRGPDLVFELANPAYYQLVGHRDILGKPVREALPEIAGQGYFELLDRVLATGEPFVGRGLEVMVQRTPGAAMSSARVDLVYQPIRGPEGGTIGVLAQGHDVTDAHDQAMQREAAETALRTSEQRYRALFDAIDDGYCLMQMIVDATGKTIDYRFLEANASFEQQSGLIQAVGKTARELVPDLDESWFALYGGVAATGAPARFENHAPAMGRWFDVYANRVGDPALRQVAIVFKDVTARKEAEAEAARLFERERAARKEAEAASLLRDQFLATVSHELRTPLAAILGWVQMLRTATLPAEKRERALETVERNARAQAQLIEDLLDVSRILAGQLRIEVEPIELRPVVEAALETMRPAALARDIRLQATLASGAFVMGDAHRLQQVVWNLVSNAVKFTPKGGRVQVLLTLEESSVEVSVADTGRGISPAFLPHVFERFRQADGATTRSHGGLGLGLSIVRELVELHGGTVAAASEGDGQGAVFTVRLPLAVARRRTPVLPVGTPAPPATGQLICPPEIADLRVLVVDDEDDTRDMLHTLLQGCHVNVQLAASAAEALAAVRADPPDLLLSDIGMPGEDGLSLIAKIRALPPEAGGRIPAVALTAYARMEDRARALHAGFDNHVAKPVEPIELLAVIASFARRRQ